VHRVNILIVRYNLNIALGLLLLPLASLPDLEAEWVCTVWVLCVRVRVYFPCWHPNSWDDQGQTWHTVSSWPKGVLWSSISQSHNVFLAAKKVAVRLLTLGRLDERRTHENGGAVGDGADSLRPEDGSWFTLWYNETIKNSKQRYYKWMSAIFNFLLPTEMSQKKMWRILQKNVNLIRVYCGTLMSALAKCFWSHCHIIAHFTLVKFHPLFAIICMVNKNIHNIWQRLPTTRKVELHLLQVLSSDGALIVIRNSDARDRPCSYGR